MAKQFKRENSVSDGRFEGGGWYRIERVLIGNHARHIGTVGVTVYNVLASMADEHYECFPSQQYIADLLGLCRATVNKTIKALAKRGLIAIKKKSRYHCRYELLNLRCQRGGVQVSNQGNQGVLPIDTNENQLKRINNDILVRVKENYIDADTEFHPRTREELLAHDLALGLDEIQNISWYLYLVRQYEESLLRRLLSEVRAEPEQRIRKSRAAFFNYLLGKYEKQNNNDPGN